MSAPSVAADPAKQKEDLSLDEIMKNYAGRWVAITVTDRDENLQPTRGIVVADEVDRYRLRTQVLKYTDICFLFAGEIPYRLMF